MSSLKLLVSECERFSNVAIEKLQAVADVTLADLDREQLLDAVADVEVLWIRLRHQIDLELLDRAPQLRFICSPTTGLNHIDMKAAENRGVQVVSLRGEFEFLRDIRATAEHTIGLMLSLMRRVPTAHADVRDGNWDRDSFRGNELHQQTIGVVGYGRLGKLVTGYLAAFGANILIADPHVEVTDAPDCAVQVSLEQLLAESNVVTLHVNLCEETTGFFDANAIGKMRDGAWLINTSRGELIDEIALLDALKSGRVSGAALDVLSNERSDGMAHHPLVRYANENDHLIITPHIGGCTTESMAKTEIFLAEKLCAAL